MKLLKKIIFPIIIVIIIYAIFLFLTDIDKIADKIINFKLEFVPIIIALVVSSWIIVYFRWNLMLKHLGYNIPHKINFQIYLVGGALGITPGKIGELYKTQILKDKFNIPRAKTFSLFILEKLFDVGGALVVTCFGIWFIPELGYLSVIGLIFVLIGFKILSSKIFFNRFLGFFERIKFFKTYLQSLSSSHDTFLDLLQKKNIFLFSSLSISYWIIIGTAAFFVVQGLGFIEIPFMNMLSIYSSSLIVGAISFIPAGIGIAEGSLIGLFTIQNVELSNAIVAVVLIRLFTLWFSTIAGFIAIKTSNVLSNTTNE
tara:strand:+ start:396 stop:1337 length:942 start_codon:yes stop_codon:yes gene_type:complete